MLIAQVVACNNENDNFHKMRGLLGVFSRLALGDAAGADLAAEIAVKIDDAVEAKAIVDDAPQPVKEGIERDEAEKLKAEIANEYLAKK